MIKPLIYGTILAFFVFQTANVPPLGAHAAPLTHHASAVH